MILIENLGRGGGEGVSEIVRLKSGVDHDSH